MYGKKSASHPDMNELIADVASMVNSSLRGRTTLNASLVEIVTNLVLFSTHISSPFDYFITVSNKNTLKCIQRIKSERQAPSG